MRYSYQEFKKLIPMAPEIEQLADELSAIGFETEIINGQLETSLTANRRNDCTSLAMVAFDYGAIKNLEVTEKRTIKPGKKIFVNLADINKILGTNLTKTEYQQMERLGFAVNDDYVIVPDFRNDLDTAADIAEEAIRLNGYDELNLTMLSRQSGAASPEYQKELSLKLALTNLGINEAITTSFGREGSWELRNPINKQERFLRPTLEDGLLQVLAKNPFLKRSAFFEIGRVFLKEEQTYVGVIIAGHKDMDAWQERLRQLLQANIALQVVSEEKTSRYDVKQGKIFFGEVAIIDCKVPHNETPIDFPLPRMKPISKFPPLIRDFTIVDKIKSNEAIISETKNKIPEILFAEVVDEYKNNETKKTFFTIRFFLQKMDSSFTDQEINQLTQKLADLLKPYQNG